VSCCDWDTFETGFIRAWHTGSRRSAPPSTLLIDWARARRDWKRYHCTGFEAAFMQLRDLSDDSLYIHVTDWRPGPGGASGGNGGGGGVLA
jgi:hypothetical protein